MKTGVFGTVVAGEGCAFQCLLQFSWHGDLYFWSRRGCFWREYAKKKNPEIGHCLPLCRPKRWDLAGGGGVGAWIQAEGEGSPSQRTERLCAHKEPTPGLR